ncbi:MAG TPA: HD-GYP domain-containing protein [Candidatus Paenibacillus intestinavium]|nr:HD-GYP domain-containing protein [Candidatus Paenibacillus intestinavium]
MRLLTIKQCKPGMRLAKKIFSEDGIVLLGEEMELTESLISRLESCHVQYVYIQDHRTGDIDHAPLISEDTFRIAVKEIRKNFSAMMTPASAHKAIKRPFIAKPLKEMMGLIIDDLSTNKDAMIMLMNMGIVDHYLYQHSLNVCVYTSVLGMSHGYSRDEVINLGLGALLHDIGKTQISIDILKKPDSLTKAEYEEMKLHTTKGFELLKEEPNFSLSIAHCAFQHHERMDGSGYPRGLVNNEIMEHAKWIGIVDSYDAMTTSRIYSSPMLPHDAMERLYAGSGTLYEQWMLAHFRDKVVIYPIGISVKLSTGVSGIVSNYNSSYPHRPIVRVLTNEAGEDLNVPYEIDMSTHLSTMIIAVNEGEITIKR